MPVFTKTQLSGSDHGTPINVTGTASGGGQLVHQVQATATNTMELVTIWVMTVATAGAVEAVFEVTNGSDSSVHFQRAHGQVLGVDPRVVPYFAQIP